MLLLPVTLVSIINYFTPLHISENYATAKNVDIRTDTKIFKSRKRTSEDIGESVLSTFATIELIIINENSSNLEKYSVHLISGYTSGRRFVLTLWGNAEKLLTFR